MRGWQAPLAARAQRGREGFLHQGPQPCVPSAAFPPTPGVLEGSLGLPSGEASPLPRLLTAEGPKALVESAMAAGDREDLPVPFPGYS